MLAPEPPLRDAAGTVKGQVIDSATGAPVSGVYVSAEYVYEITDSAGRFVMPSLEPGGHSIVAERRGFLKRRIDLTITFPDTTTVVIRIAHTALPKYELAGRWGMELALDSAGARQKPTARRVEGTIVLSEKFPSRWGPGEDPDPWVRTIEGRYQADLTPFWGTQVAPDVSTSVFGPVDSTFTREASAATFDGDSITIDFIPRMSHGGISLWGRLINADTAEGKWYQRAYCCGAVGHFRLWRISGDPGPISVPRLRSLTPPPRDALAEAERADVRVRIWDEAYHTYIKGWFDLGTPDGGTTSVYTTGTQADGWGKSFWLAPGRYRIIVNRYPCGNEQYSLKRPIERPFEARAGEHQDITIRLNTRKVEPSRSYNNTSGHRCDVVLPEALRSSD
ncbi:MAG TPA: carboxypeptidase-like regulatory domain-containing protein [Gemmatimonadaceae bacterium]|nr:carboxypeptidase-like regulatory domain-containing protein [Gemmatimonadaceae bacterium]